MNKAIFRRICLIFLLAALWIIAVAAAEEAVPQTGTHSVGDVLPIPSTSVEKWEGVTVQIVNPQPRISNISQSATSLSGEGGMTITMRASVPGKVTVELLSLVEEKILYEFSKGVEVGDNILRWDGTIRGDRVPAGAYTLILTLYAENGESSEPAYVFLDVVEAAGAADALGTGNAEGAEGQTVSPPYSNVKDGSFWSMTPGEVDDAVIWDVLMQLITVYDDGEMHASEHVYMMSNPDGTGDRVAQIHVKSQGVHVLDKEPNEYGYILCEAFSNYDPRNNPRTAEEKAHAFEIKRGYLLAENLKTINPQPDIGFVVDKLTQRMYMYQDGVRVTEFTISTGLRSEDTYYRETIAGEFITVSHIAGYWSEDVYTDLPIRLNGGTLIHEVPCLISEEGVRYYGAFERGLGTKQSAGCIRVSHVPNEEGYNMEWLYNNLKREGRYKVIIWDDLNRYDTPATWR